MTLKVAKLNKYEKVYNLKIVVKKQKEKKENIGVRYKEYQRNIKTKTEISCRRALTEFKL